MTTRANRRARHKRHKDRSAASKDAEALRMLRALVRKVAWHTNYYPDLGPTGRVALTDMLGFQAVDALRKLRDADALLDAGGIMPPVRGHY